jgi:UDP-3-O-[3-hydroxymyristoyl] glucosamine N-acyltransferase
MLAGQVGISDHCRLEDGVIVGGQSGIPSKRVVRRGQFVFGSPARPFTRFKEQYSWILKLPELAQRLEALEVESGAKPQSA